MIPGTIHDVLRNKGSQVWIIAPDATIFEAIQLMAERNVGALLVMKEGRVMGVISERDYTRKVALKGLSSREARVSQIVSSQLITVTPAQSVEDGMRLMTVHRVRHLPVLEGEQLVGLVSIGDLVNWIISAQTATIHQLHSYISGQYPG
jgi:CBS domain-containing protein